MKPICALYGGCCIGGFASFERREAVEGGGTRRGDFRIGLNVQWACFPGFFLINN